MSSNCRRRCTPVIRTRGRTGLLLIPLPSSGPIVLRGRLRPGDLRGAGRPGGGGAGGRRAARGGGTAADGSRSARRRDRRAPLGGEPDRVGPLDGAGPAELL